MDRIAGRAFADIGSLPAEGIHQGRFRTQRTGQYVLQRPVAVQKLTDTLRAGDCLHQPIGFRVQLLGQQKSLTGGAAHHLVIYIRTGLLAPAVLTAKPPRLQEPDVLK